MVLIKRLYLLVTLLLAGISTARAQERCGTVQYENMLQGLNPSRSNTDQFEQWMKAKLTQDLLLQSTGRTEASSYVIPVVVHVIHNGEALGVGGNIPDAQIVSQIGVLNEDFQRLNADASKTLSEFQSLAGSLNIQFVLAKQDPNGVATSGILRVKGTQASWAFSDNYALKSLSYWPAENYLNLWVTNLSSTLLGYAQVPPTDGLSSLGGLDGNTSDRITDGVVIDYTTFGKGSFSTLISPYNLGRTATHEIGHFFGLRHIWGDDKSCSTTTDYVDDTPKQVAATESCPSTAQTSNGCSGAEVMFQNYMDYTFDACMNLYSKGQVARMEIVLNNSPRRKSLLASPGATAPPSFDVGIREVTSPKSTSCSGTLTPTITVTNPGTVTITSVKIQFSFNGTVVETKDVSINLAPQSSTSISFGNINVTQGTSNQLLFSVMTTNGTTDDNAFNNIYSQTVVVPAIANASLAEIFNTIPINWSVLNPDALKTWEITTAGNVAADNKAVYVNYYNYSTSDNDGTTDWLITPVMDFSKVNSALLKFDRAYAQYTTSSSDGLKILVSSNCGADFTQAVSIFNKSGSSLATNKNSSSGNINPTSSSFTPTGSAQWVTETISLQQFIGQSNIQLAFVVTNGAGQGNNFYLDNVLLTSDAFTDIALTNVTSLSPVICSTNPVSSITIKNNGSSPITSFNIDVTVNGVTATQSYTNQYIQTNESKNLILNALTLIAGTNNVTINVKDPNGITTDALPANNTYTITTVVNTSKDIIPLRQNFETTFTPAWTIVSQGTQRKWEAINTTKGTSLVFKAFTNTTIGNEAWFVSPLLDFSNAQQASLFFDVSYAKATQGNDGFKILASTDCGTTYPEVVYQRTGDQLSIANYNFSWTPSLTTDWKREYVDLSGLATKENVRLAFVVTNNHGNNLYIDNLEFFTDSNPSPPSISNQYSIYSLASDPSVYKITFNLQNKVNARVQIYDVMGQMVVDDDLPETLNQTYTLDLSQSSTGIYIVRLQMDKYVGSQKIFVGH